MTSAFVASDEVRQALAEHRPVVALESTIISHGLPRPRNLEAARDFEAVLRDQGVVPATIAVIDGVPRVGLEPAELERIAQDEDVVKVSTRELGLAVVQRRTGATTVAATSTLAHLAGIRVFATGGLGGVHRDANESFDESADLVALSRTPITVVAAGVKSILDIPATLERLETLGVTVAGYRTTQFPAFYLNDSGHAVDWRVDSPEQIAELMAAGDALGSQSAVLVANPVDTADQLDPELHDRVLGEALQAAHDRHITGKAVSPFLLDYLQRATDGASLEVNVTIARSNVALGGQIATAWARLQA